MWCVCINWICIVLVCILGTLHQVVNDRLRKSYIAARLKSMEQGTKIDWATAEALAIGTLLHQGRFNDPFCF